MRTAVAPPPNPAGLDRGNQSYITPRPRKKRNDAFTPDWTYADKQLELMECCGRQVVRFVHKRIICNASIFIPTSCRVRPCPHCGKARTARELGRYAEQVEGFKMPALLTLTVANVDTIEELCKALETLTKGFSKLRRHKLWPKGARGVWSLEITWNKDTGYHPHIHAVVDLPWIDLRWLSKAWFDLTGAKHCPDVTRPKTAEERQNLPYEALKYVTKAWELPKDVLRGILAVIGRRKMLNSFGGMRAKKEEKVPTGACCPGCETPLAHCFKNMERATLSQEEAANVQTWLKSEGHPVYTDWYYPDREADRDRPRGGGP